MKTANVRPIFSLLVGAICFILLTLFDQLTKWWAVFYLSGRDPVPIFGDAFCLRYLENHGAAFGILQGRQVVFVIITLAVLALIVYLYARMPYLRKYRILRVLMVFIASGAVGNFIDRVSQGYVVDFFYIQLINFPIFNVADMYVTISVIVLVLYLLFGLKDEDYTEITRHLGFSREKAPENDEEGDTDDAAGV